MATHQYLRRHCIFSASVILIFFCLDLQLVASISYYLPLIFGTLFFLLLKETGSYMQKQSRARTTKPPKTRCRKGFLRPEQRKIRENELSNKATLQGLLDQNKGKTSENKQSNKETHKGLLDQNKGKTREDKQSNKETHKGPGLSAAEFVLFKAAFLRLIHGMVSQLISKLF